VSQHGEAIEFQRLAQRLEVLDGPREAQLRWIAGLGLAAAPGVVVHQPEFLGERVERAHVLVTELRPADHDEGWSGAYGVDMHIEVARMHNVNRALQRPALLRPVVNPLSGSAWVPPARRSKCHGTLAMT